MLWDLLVALTSEENYEEMLEILALYLLNN